MEKKFNNVLRLIKKFRVEELPKVIENTFGCNAWEEIKSFALKHKLVLSNCRNISMICLNIYKAQKPTAADIQKVLWYLKFFDVSCHPAVTWKCARLLNMVDNFPTDMEDLRAKIIHSYRCEARDLDMIIIRKEDLIWIMVIEKKITKKGIKFGNPFFFVVNINLENQYIFFYPESENSSNDVDHLMLISKALGYEEYNKVSFEGKDVKSLFEMIKRHTTEQNQIAVFQPSKCSLEGNVLDFTQGKDRSNYASDVLPPGLTNLSNFTVHSRDQWRGNMPLCRSSLVTTQLRIRVKGHSFSVETLLRELISLGLVAIPVPQYISRLPYLNRNVVQIKSSNENQSNGDVNYNDDDDDDDDDI